MSLEDLLNGGELIFGITQILLFTFQFNYIDNLIVDDGDNGHEVTVF